MTFDTSIIVSLYGRMTAERQRAFWQLRGTSELKIAYLMRWGTYVDLQGPAAGLRAV